MNMRKSGFIFYLKQIVRIMIYIPIQLVFIPFAIVGIIVGAYKTMNKSQKIGVSFTSIRALQYRWVLHYFNVRKDNLSVRFVKNFPYESHLGLLSVYGALIIAHRLLGLVTIGKLPLPGEETIVSSAGKRVVLFDEILSKYIHDIDQIVIPGVGFDLISLRFTEDKNIDVYELDQVKTLNAKVETLEKAGITHDWINFIPVDYSKDSWVEKLLDAGFDRSKKTLFIWQSVSLFLKEEIVKKTLLEMTELGGKGSIVVQDFYSQAFISGEISKAIKKTANLVEKKGEPWRFGLDMSANSEVAVKEFLNECGLELTKFHMFGEKLNIMPYYCIVESQSLN